jgi:Zn-dependent M16 (insulinase) family peptidase
MFLLAYWLLMATGLKTLAAGFEPGTTHHGFTVNEKRFVKEVNAECLSFEHVKSGARLLKIVADDPNKTFGIAFKTVPQSDCGTAHIMEHMVLNGSKHFPVKSPFDILSQGSLRTFLNAFTGSDITIYPVASMNEKDYFNLMHVYLDAVFYPLVYSDPRIFKQEGWHYELADTSGPLTYKGVVYNEMKGAYSSPTRELDYQIKRRLFPDNGYGFTAGGYPTAIPRLTYEAALDFHRRYYSPDNSYIVLYGNADVDQELSMIDSLYLSNFQRSGTTIDIPLEHPFAAMKEATAYYPVAEGGSTDNQTYLSLSFVAGLNTDQPLVMALSVLKDVLVNQQSAPVRLALQEAGIGREVSADLDDLRQNVFTITVQNANAKDKTRFRDVVMKTLSKVAGEGLNKQAVEGTINRMEFGLREGNDAQKGLTYMLQTMPTWFFSGDPFRGLEYERPLATVKTALESDYLESIIRKHMLENHHALLLALEPKPGLENETSAAIEAELTAHKRTLTGKGVEALVRETKDLVAYQEREDPSEALATIPVLNLQDISPNAEWYGVTEREISGIPLLYHGEFTNNVVYLKLYFDARVLPVELIPYASLLSEVLGNLNTQNYAYSDLDIALNIHTGGFNASVDSYLEQRSDAKLEPKVVVSAKALNAKLDKLFELVGEIVSRTRYGDHDRLKVVLTQHQSRLDGRIRREGLRYALTRLESYYTNYGKFDELTGGVEYYWFVTDLVKQFDQKADEISANLARTASLLFTKGNVVAAVTCSGQDLPTVSAGFEQFARDLKEGKSVQAEWKFDFDKKNEGLLTASKVQYVVKGYDFAKLGYRWNGKMRVLNQVLSRDWLQNRVRVIGGAYGGFAAITPYGRASFASYRDPNLKETLKNYDATPEYLRTFDPDKETMTRFIIGTVARLDQPLTPSARGDRAVQYHFEKTTNGDLQAERADVLGTTVADIRSMEKFVGDILKQNAYCVYGNEEKIESSKELFKHLVKPLR